MIKRLLCTVLMITALWMLWACQKDLPTATVAAPAPASHVTAPTTEPTIPESITRDLIKTTVSKDHVPEFLALLGDVDASNTLLSGCVFNAETCFNVTPPQVAAETDIKIFKFSDSCVSLILLDGKIYMPCESFGGFGLVNAVPCDFDSDGNQDLLLASSWGSGIHRSIISVFNSVTKEITEVYNTIDSSDPDRDLIVMADSTASGVVYYVCTVDITLDYEAFNGADLSYMVTGMVGRIESVNGIPEFYAY